MNYVGVTAHYWRLILNHMILLAVCPTYKYDSFLTYWTQPSWTMYIDVQ